jgi:hypothetical protein
MLPLFICLTWTGDTALPPLRLPVHYPHVLASPDQCELSLPDGKYKILCAQSPIILNAA